jgi:hypothetical protein
MSVRWFRLSFVFVTCDSNLRFGGVAARSVFWWKSGFDAVFRPVARDSGPLFESFVGGNDDRSTFVALADKLEQQVSATLIHGWVTDLI